MSLARLRRGGFAASSWLVGLALAGLACATTPRAPTPAGPAYDFFASSDLATDADWDAKIVAWQARQRDGARVPPGSPEALDERGRGALPDEFAAFESGERLRLARRIAVWSQIKAIQYYRNDPRTDFENDPWPTTEELFVSGGDDCDGLDLLAYALFDRFGFPRDRIYRAVVQRDRDRRNHMVTLWFEDDDDPWVIDATTAMTKPVVRWSTLEGTGWTPLYVFNDSRRFAVVLRPGAGAQLARRARRAR